MFRFPCVASLCAPFLISILSLSACEGTLSSLGNGAGVDGGGRDAGATDAGGNRDGGGTDAGPERVCGDGIVVAPEQCDDGNTLPGDGCSDICALEDGFVCPAPGEGCRVTVCGDGVPEGSEACDDANNQIGDGCTPFCDREPDCSTGTCLAVCGDGQVFPGEACDDGNVRDGDGCSADCALEAGFECELVTSDPPEELGLPVVFRDLKAEHPDMQEGACGLEAGMVEDRWGADRKPVPVIPSPCSSGPQSAASFAQWYNDSSEALTLAEQLPLVRNGSGGNFTYVFDDDQFFPLDGRGWSTLGEPELSGDGGNHNFHFTSEVRFWFQYDASSSATLRFRGDDDVWVFINGRLAVDIGGVHGAEPGEVTLDASSAAALGLVDGEIYEAAVFQAERQTVESNYRLELQNFFPGRTVCEAGCGDGVVTVGEQCDDGNRENGDGCDENCRSELI